jgi:hypothetical protein
MLNKEWACDLCFLKGEQGKFGAAVKSVGSKLVAEFSGRELRRDFQVSRRNRIYFKINVFWLTHVSILPTVEIHIKPLE